MMSKTHIAIGVASALAIAQTGSPESCVAAIVGGSIGGIMADCDITPSKMHKDALRGRLIVVGLAAICLATDYFLGGGAGGHDAQLDWVMSSQIGQVVSEQGMCNYVVSHLGLPLLAGIALFVLLTFFGAHTDHRSFTHSLVAMAGFTFATHLVCEPLVAYFAIGYASHLLLDMTNKQGIQLFWPLGLKLSLGLCSAKGKANTVVMVAGVAAATLLLAWRLAPLAGISIITP